MLFSLKFGILQTPIDIEESLMKCPSCEHDTWSELMVISNYYHFSFVPIFPTSREVNVICGECGFKRYGVPFDLIHFNKYNEMKNKFRHSWYTYIGIGIPIIIILIVIIFSFL